MTDTTATTADVETGVHAGRRSRVVPPLLVSGVALAFLIYLRAGYLRWGANDAEVQMALPGDELMASAQLTATRAITVRADPDAVWPWIAQLGQGRGGFYTYDFLENLAGCNIHSSDQVVPEWQNVAVGDAVHLHPDLTLRVAVLEPSRALVLRGGVPMGAATPPYDFTWSFVVCPGPDGMTRLVVRERYQYTRAWAGLLVEPVELVSFVMSQRMMRGIRDRAERTGVER